MLLLLWCGMANSGSTSRCCNDCCVQVDGDGDDERRDEGLGRVFLSTGANNNVKVE